MTSLDEGVQRFLIRHRLIDPDAPLLAGVSGGADSMTLLAVLAALRSIRTFRLTVVHVDHGLRAESADDADFVEAQGRRLAVPVIVLRRNAAELAKRDRRSLEDAARRARYAAFEEAARRCGARTLLLAHTADDQAETVLLRLLRGAGLTGLSAMAPVRRQGALAVARPLLEIRRAEVLAYVREQGLAFRDDASNTDLRFTRNRIRAQLLPLLERDYNPNARAALVQLADQAACDAAYLAEAAQRQWKRLAKRRGTEVRLRLAAYQRQPRAVQRQLVRLALQALQGDLTGFEFRHWTEIERLVADRPAGSIVDLPDGVQAVRERESLTLRLSANAL